MKRDPTNQPPIKTFSHHHITISAFTKFSKLAGVHKNEKPINITVMDTIHIKRDSIGRSMANSVSEPIFYSFALDELPGQKLQKDTIIRQNEERNKPVFISNHILLTR